MTETNKQKRGDSVEEKIKKLTKYVKLLSKLMIAVAELLTFALLVVSALKTLISAWFNL